MWAYIKSLYRKEVENMAVIYAQLVFKGLRTFKQVPPVFKDQTRKVIQAMDLDPEVEASLLEE